MYIKSIYLDKHYGSTIALDKASNCWVNNFLVWLERKINRDWRFNCTVSWYKYVYVWIFLG
jgi:hypothetical protein